MIITSCMLVLCFYLLNIKIVLLKNSTELSFKGDFLKCIPLLIPEFIFRRNKIYS